MQLFIHYTFWIFKSSSSFSKNILREINNTAGLNSFESGRIRLGSQQHEQLSSKATVPWVHHPQIIKNAKAKTPIIKRESML